MLTRTFCSLARVSSRLPAITPVVYQTQRTYAKKPDNNNNKGTGGPAKTGSSGKAELPYEKRVESILPQVKTRYNSLEKPAAHTGNIAKIIDAVFPSALAHGALSTTVLELKTLADLIKSGYGDQFNQALKSGVSVVKTGHAALIIEQLAENRAIDKLPIVVSILEDLEGQFFEKYDVSIILPETPSDADVQLLRTELLDCYFGKEVNLNLTIQVDEKIGKGRIYCFKNFMLDLSTSSVESEILVELKHEKGKLNRLFEELDQVWRTPLNADLPARNSNYTAAANQEIDRANKYLGYTA